MERGLTVTLSRERRSFKHAIGQTNHFLITLLVGLHAVEEGKATPPPALHAPWNPKNVNASATRAKDFALGAGLTWAVAALGAYVGSVARTPLVSQRLREELKKATDDDGLRGRVLTLGREANAPERETMLTVLAIAWRNTLVHARPQERRLPRGVTNALERLAADIASSYHGLDVALALQRVAARKAPRWKETGSLIPAIHRYVAAVDEALLAAADHEVLARSVLTTYLFEDEARIDDRFNNVWSKDTETRQKTIENILRNYGASGVDHPGDATISPGWIKRAADLGVKEAKLHFGAAS